MVCDTKLFAGQTVEARAEEIQRVVLRLTEGLVNGTITAVVGPQGGIAFDGLTDTRGVSDACAYMQVMASDNALAKLAIMQAEQLAGRGVDQQALAHGAHSHDGGKTWHEGH
jgi:hypothetical protein